MAKISLQGKSNLLKDNIPNYLLLHEQISYRTLLKSTYYINSSNNRSCVPNTCRKQSDFHKDNCVSSKGTFFLSGLYMCPQQCEIFLLHLQSVFLQRETSFCFNIPCRVRTTTTKKLKFNNSIFINIYIYNFCKYLGYEGK